MGSMIQFISATTDYPDNSKRLPPLNEEDSLLIVTYYKWEF